MFVVCGEALWDLFGRDDGAGGLAFEARIGGSPFNVAVGLARLGRPAALFGGLSTDRLGERLAGALAAEGVSTALLKRTARPTTLSMVETDAAGSPVYAFYGEGAADRAVDVGDLPAFGAEVWGVHAGSYCLVAEPVGSALLALFEREAGRRLLSLDPNARLAVEPDGARWRARIDRFAAHADLVKASAEDFELLYPGEDRDAVVAHWLDLGARLVVVTLGPDGAEAHSAAHGRVAVAGRAIRVVDTVGAGDTFQAALIAGLAERGATTRAALDRLDRDALTTLLDFAVEAAAITCTRRGADLPRRGELSTPVMEAR
ncbi:MAG: carbohydrate kinase [Paracoccaceae bacterium]